MKYEEPAYQWDLSGMPLSVKRFYIVEQIDHIVDYIVNSSQVQLPKALVRVILKDSHDKWVLFHQQTSTKSSGCLQTENFPGDSCSPTQDNRTNSDRWRFKSKHFRMFSRRLERTQENSVNQNGNLALEWCGKERYGQTTRNCFPILKCVILVMTIVTSIRRLIMKIGLPTAWIMSIVKNIQTVCKSETHVTPFGTFGNPAL